MLKNNVTFGYDKTFLSVLIEKCSRVFKKFIVNMLKKLVVRQMYLNATERLAPLPISSSVAERMIERRPFVNTRPYSHKEKALREITYLKSEVLFS